MTSWRFITDEQAQAAHKSRPDAATGDELIDIFEVVRGSVESANGMRATPKAGWFVRILDRIVEEAWSYRVVEMSVKMNGRIVDLKPGTWVALLPPNYREIADDA